MKRMRPVAKAIRNGLREAPRWSLLLLAVLIAVDAAHLMLQVRVEARTANTPSRGAVGPAPASFAALDPQQIVRAHLFGVDPTRARGSRTGAPETPLRLALKGVIATSDPTDGYAILSVQGEAMKLYRTGAELVEASDRTLYQVFADHVVLDFHGELENLSLPRQSLNVAAAARLARLDAAAAAEPGGSEEPPSNAQSWFGGLYAEPYTENGQTRLRLHPTKHYQRRYGLQDGDTLTAVNGVPAGDEAAVDGALRAGGQTVALTLTRNGIQETLTFPVAE